MSDSERLENYAHLYGSPTCPMADVKWHEFLYRLSFNPHNGELREKDGRLFGQYFDAVVTGFSNVLTGERDMQHVTVLVSNPDEHVIPDVWRHEHSALVLAADSVYLAALHRQDTGELVWQIRRPVRRGKTIDYQQEIAPIVRDHLRQIQAARSQGQSSMQSFKEWHQNRPHPFVTH